MRLSLQLTIDLLCAGLAAATVPLLLSAWRQPLPHLAVMVALWLFGYAAIVSSFLLTQFGLASAATPRFYQGMLTGMGLGALLSFVIMYVLDRRKSE
jgi:hypothetical protein